MRERAVLLRAVFGKWEKSRAWSQARRRLWNRPAGSAFREIAADMRKCCMGGWMLVLPRPADKHQGVPPNCLPGGGQSPPYGCGRRTLVVTSCLTATDGAQSAPDTVGAVAADDLR